MIGQDLFQTQMFIILSLFSTSHSQYHIWPLSTMISKLSYPSPTHFFKISRTSGLWFLHYIHRRSPFHFIKIQQPGFKSTFNKTCPPFFLPLIRYCPVITSWRPGDQSMNTSLPPQIMLLGSLSLSPLQKCLFWGIWVPKRIHLPADGRRWVSQIPASSQNVLLDDRKIPQ